MSFPVYFYSFNKAENSTKIPGADTPFESQDCVLKEQTSILTPSVLVKFTSLPTGFNYARIQAFEDRYYFIEEWVNVRGSLWEARLKVDVMGTYRTQIGEQEQFVERAQSASDFTLTDRLAIGTSHVINSSGVTQSPWSTSPANSYVVEIVGQNQSTYYIFSGSQYDEFIQRLFGNEYVESIYNSWGELYPELKTQLNPLQYIGSVRYYPFVFSTGTLVTSISVGWGTVSVPARVTGLLDGLIEWNYTIDMLPHPQEETYPFVGTAPFTEYEVVVPPFGSVPIDPGSLGPNKTVYITIKVDLGSGMGNLIVKTTSQQAECNTRIGVEIRVGQVYNTPPSPASFISAAANIVASAATGNLVGTVGAMSSSVQNILGNSTPKLRTSGSNGSISGIKQDINYYGRFQQIKMPDPERVGYLLYAKRIINTLTGFIKTDGAHIEIPGCLTETKEIENTMDGGFYYE